MQSTPRKCRIAWAAAVAFGPLATGAAATADAPGRPGDEVCPDYCYCPGQGFGRDYHRGESPWGHVGFNPLLTGWQPLYPLPAPFPAGANVGCDPTPEPGAKPDVDGR